MTGHGSQSSTARGVYASQLPGKDIAVDLSLDVVDRMLQDVMRGFGAVPRRGAEVGGILMGSVTPGHPSVIRIEDYELVPIEYKRGPSYLMSEEDEAKFGAKVLALRARGTPDLRPIGYFRSHTREAVGLGNEDRQLLAKYFPEPDAIVLWIQPYATKVGVAGYYVRENGEFPSGRPAAEFPFRRKELAPSEAAAAKRASEAAPAPPTPRPIPVPEIRTAQPPPPEPVFPSPQSYYVETAAPAPAPAVESDKGRRRWFWVPLSFIFLLLGVLLGFQAALSMRPTGPSTAQLFSVSLNVTKSGDDLHVRWDRQALAIRTAQRGSLTIEDGAFSKTLDLDTSQLQNGSVVYRHSSPHVRFQLQVFPAAPDVLTETVDWNQ